MRLLVFILSFLISLLSSAQLPDYHVQLFDESFGVRTSDVRAVTKDSLGFIWIMHHDRVQKFDGKRIKDFIVDGSLRSMLCDRDNRIWVSTFSALYYLKDERRGFVPVVVDTITNLRISMMFQLPGEEVWVLTNKGYYVFDREQHAFNPHQHHELGHLDKVQIRGAGKYENTVFFYSADSLIAYNHLTHVKRTLSLPEFNIRTITGLSEDHAFVSIWKGIIYLYDFSNHKVKEIDLSRHLTNVQDYFATIFEAKPVSDHEFILATSKGLMEYNSNSGDFRKLQLFHKGKPLEGNLFFMDIFIDADGMAWAAYNNYGLISFKTGRGEIGLIRNYETDIFKAWDNHVRNFAEDENGNLWLATFNGFASLDVDKGTIQPYFAKEGAEDQVNHFSIRGIVYDGTNLILGQTNRGVWLYNPHTKKYKRPNYLPGAQGQLTREKLEASFTEQIYTLQNGNHIIAGSNAAYYIDKNSYLVTEIDFPGAKDNLNFSFQDHLANIWLGTDKELHCLDSAFHFKFSITKKQTSGFVNGMCQWKNDTLILAGHGLHLVSYQDTIATISNVNSFFDAIVIQTVYRDPNDKLWLATSEGLFRYDMQTRKIESFSNFENIDGNSFYPNSVWYTSEGLLFLGSSRGIIYFDPGKIGEQKNTAEILITQILVNEDDTLFMTKSSPIHLKYFQNNLAFDFVAPYFENANKLRYRYRMQGLDEEWIDNGNNNTVRFHSLPAGHYQFQAAVSLNGVDWFEGNELIAFSINAPFWKTTWFYILVILIITLIMYALYRYQLNKKLEVERLRMGIARDLHDDIGSALSNIHILSSMAANKQGGNGQAGMVFSKIKESSKTIMENMQDIVWAINPENDSLEQVLSKMKEFSAELCESAGMEYKFETVDDLGNEKINVRKRKEVLLIFKEAINNAVKYSDASVIHIRVYKKQNGLLMLEIKDNGRGFNQDEIHPGNGLRNMNARAKEIQGQLFITSASGLGTTILLEMPIT